MPGRSFRIARIAGIPVGVSPWWMAIVALITNERAEDAQTSHPS
jgi:hypothetical protein